MKRSVVADEAVSLVFDGGDFLTMADVLDVAAAELSVDVGVVHHDVAADTRVGGGVVVSDDSSFVRSVRHDFNIDTKSKKKWKI